MTFAIAMGGFDLSVGSVQVLAAITVAGLLSAIDPPLAILSALLTGMLLGLLNGTLISKLRLPAFVVTFAMMSIVRGMALLVTQGQSVMITKHLEFGLLNNGKILGLPVPFIIMLLVFLVLGTLLNHTPFGRGACAIGGNRTAAIASGINVDRTTIAVFSLVGVTAAISGVMLSSKLMIVEPTLGNRVRTSGYYCQRARRHQNFRRTWEFAWNSLCGPAFGNHRQRLEYILKIIAVYQYLALSILLILALSIDAARRAFITKLLLRRT
jgi:ribose/xylose/arabinose/galactoside ABC-type transport system permease subunit